MNKEELKALRKRLDDYLRKLVNKDKEIGCIDWKDAHIFNIEINMVIINLILQENEEPKESKPDKIKRLVARLCDLYSYKGFNIALSRSNFDFEEIEELEKEIDELLKDL